VQSIVHRSLNMFTLIAIGTGTAYVYSVVAVLYPFFGLLLSPMLAAAAMTFSSVSVITNALRLRRVDL
jgi:Cu+-exporting ATPase